MAARGGRGDRDVGRSVRPARAATAAWRGFRRLQAWRRSQATESAAAGTTHDIVADCSNDNYAITVVPGTLTIVKAAGSVNIDNVPTADADKIVGGSFTPTYTLLGDGTASVASTTALTGAVTDGVVHFTAAGECVLQPSVGEGTNHAAAEGQPQTVTILPVTPTIAWGPNLPGIVYGTILGDAQRTATATIADQSVPGTFVYSFDHDTGPRSAGTHTLTVDFTPSDDSYTTASGSADIAIAKATAAVALSSLTQIHTGGDLTPSATTVAAGLAIVWTGAPQVEVGEYDVTATVDDVNHEGEASGLFTIEPQPGATPEGTSVVVDSAGE